MCAELHLSLRDVLEMGPADFWLWGLKAYELRLERRALAGVVDETGAVEDLDEMLFGGPDKAVSKAIRKWNKQVGEEIRRKHGAGRNRK